MSAPFIYSPYAPWTSQLPFPMQPTTPTIYPSSPYPIPFSAGSSGTGSSASDHNAPYSALDFGGQDSYFTPRRKHRRRRASWAGGQAQTTPFIPPDLDPEPPAAQQPPWFAPYQAQPQWPMPFTNPGPTPFPSTTFPSSTGFPYVSQFAQTQQLSIHPMLSADGPNGLVFDLALPSFIPLRALDYSLGPGGEAQLVPLTAADIGVPAFSPSLTRLRIVCDMLPKFWPIDLVFHGPATYAPPITLGDILIAVHQKMQQPITHEEWAALASTDVARSFARRCKRDAFARATGSIRSDTPSARDKGVLVVDFLGGRTMFAGISNEPDGSVKLITRRAE